MSEWQKTEIGALYDGHEMSWGRASGRWRPVTDDDTSWSWRLSNVDEQTQRHRRSVQGKPDFALFFDVEILPNGGLPMADLSWSPYETWAAET